MALVSRGRFNHKRCTHQQQSGIKRSHPEEDDNNTVSNPSQRHGTTVGSTPNQRRKLTLNSYQYSHNQQHHNPNHNYGHEQSYGNEQSLFPENYTPTSPRNMNPGNSSVDTLGTLGTLGMTALQIASRSPHGTSRSPHGTSSLGSNTGVTATAFDRAIMDTFERMAAHNPQPNMNQITDPKQEIHRLWSVTNELALKGCSLSDKYAWSLRRIEELTMTVLNLQQALNESPRQNSGKLYKFSFPSLSMFT